MKVLALILSIYILGLNIVPCADYDTSTQEVKTEVSQALDHDHQHQDSDLCSPFCQCHCCHIHVAQFKTAEYELSNSFILTQLFYYFDGFEKHYNHTLLQPPQV